MNLDKELHVGTAQDSAMPMDAETATDAMPAQKPRIGLMLRARREALGKDIDELARKLRIRALYISAIEEDRLRDLPGSAYALGFVRSYAESLGLPGEQAVAAYREELARHGRQPQLIFPKEGRRSYASIPFVAGAVLATAAALYGIWYYFSQPGESAIDMIEAVPEHFGQDSVASGDAADASSAPNAQTSNAAPSPAADAAAAPSPAADAAAAPSPAMPAQQTPAALVPESSAVQQTLPEGQTSAAPLAQAPTPATPTPPAPTIAPGAANLAAISALATGATPTAPATPENQALPTSRVVVHARMNSWIEVRNALGTVVAQRILGAGESYAVPGQNGLTLTVGNAGGIDLMLDGKALPSLGAIGAVRRGIALDPARLADGSALAAAPALAPEKPMPLQPPAAAPTGPGSAPAN